MDVELEHLAVRFRAGHGRTVTVDQVGLMYPNDLPTIEPLMPPVLLTTPRLDLVRSGRIDSGTGHQLDTPDRTPLTIGRRTLVCWAPPQHTLFG